MEQRTFLAIILSLIVLVVYGALTPQPKGAVKNQNISQIIENKEVIKQPLLSSEKNSTSAAPPSFIHEKVNTIETDAFLGEFSNLGGKLKKISIKQFSYSPFIKDIITVDGYENVSFKLDNITADTIQYSFENNEIRILKKYAFDRFKILAETSVFKKTRILNEIGQKINSFTIDYSSLDKNNLPKNYLTERSLFEYSVSTPSGIFRKANAYGFNDKEKKLLSEKINWTAYRDRYFCVIVKPQSEVSQEFISPLNENELRLTMYSAANGSAPDQRQDSNALIYVGPQDIKLLRSSDPEFPEVMNFKIGGFMDIMTFGMTDAISKLMLKALNFTHDFIPNWGICIIILALSVYGITYPLTLQSMNSVKKMQQLQPEIKKLQDQNKDNPQKLQKEMMALYKKHKFNPFGGCLPMFLQMPIFVSLYQVLWRSFNFKGANFLWIKDLSEPDRFVILPYTMPFLGNEINILPFIVMIAMFFQQKNSLKNMTVTDPAQVAQQKMMANILPIMIGFVFYRVASGLALYFAIFYSLSTFSQWRMSSQGKKPLQGYS